MKRYIPIVASLMVFSLISCDEVMDLTQPEKAEVTYSNITLSLYQTGKYDLYLDEPEYQYNIMVEKSHCEKEAKAKLAVVDAKEFEKNITSYLWNIMIWMGVILILRGTMSCVW